MRDPGGTPGHGSSGTSGMVALQARCRDERRCSPAPRTERLQVGFDAAVDQPRNVDGVITSARHLRTATVLRVGLVRVPGGAAGFVVATARHSGR